MADFATVYNQKINLDNVLKVEYSFPRIVCGQASGYTDVIVHPEALILTVVGTSDKIYLAPPTPMEFGDDLIALNELVKQMQDIGTLTDESKHIWTIHSLTDILDAIEDDRVPNEHDIRNVRWVIDLPSYSLSSWNLNQWKEPAVIKILENERDLMRKHLESYHDLSKLIVDELNKINTILENYDCPIDDELNMFWMDL